MAVHGYAHVHARRKEEEIVSRLCSTALFVGGLSLLSTGGGLAPSPASAGAPPVEAARAERVTVDPGSAEITFPTPKRFAVVKQADGKVL